MYLRLIGLSVLAILVCDLVGCVSDPAPIFQDQGVVPRDAEARSIILDQSVDGTSATQDSSVDGALVDVGAAEDMGGFEDASIVDAGPVVLGLDSGQVDTDVADLGVEDASIIDAAEADPDMMLEPDVMLRLDAALPLPGHPERVEQPQGTRVRGNAMGGQRFDDVCPIGEVLIGVAGEIRGGASYLGRLRSLCGEMVTGPQLINTVGGVVLPLRGGQGGGGQFGATCPAGSGVIGYSGRAGALMDQLVMHCAPLLRDNDNTLSPGVVVALPAVGGNGGAAFPLVGCGGRRFAVGTIIRAGDGIDGFGLLCSNIDVVP